MRVVVTGGQGDLGARVVRRLRQAGHDVTPASRRTGVDLATGAGLRDVLVGAHAVVHCATNPARAAAVDVAGTRLLVDAVAQEGYRSGIAPHLVSVSIVGCDRTPLPYYRAKYGSELAIARAGVPATIARATQFHALAAFVAKTLRLGPFGLTIRDLAIQPVDIDWVAARLADHAQGPPPHGLRRAVDLAGPEVHTLPELARRVAEHEGRHPRRRTLRVRPLGATMGAFSQGSIVPAGEVDTGGRRFEDWLAEQPSPLPRGMHERS